MKRIRSGWAEPTTRRVIDSPTWRISADAVPPMKPTGQRSGSRRSR